MDDFPAKIADLLETTATRVRATTVDRVRGWAVWTAVGLVVGTLGLLMAVFLVVALFRLLAELVGTEPAYLILGGLFVVIGMFLWSKRMPKGTARSARSRTKKERNA